MAQTMPEPLPILLRRAEIEAALSRHQVVIVCGETGSGKTTQLPQICLETGLGSRGMIGHTQPRRLAARAVAARIAEERGTRLGGLVGVKVRFDDRTGRDTKIKVMTDGMLLAELAADPGCSTYQTIIIDEAHERSLNIDFLLGYLRGLLPRRPDLKLIITSATIDPARFSNHFGGPGLAPVIEVSGRMFPVEIRYRPTGGDEEEFERIETEAVADAVEELSSPRLPGGDILVFVPGEREIRQCADALRRRGPRAEILPLYSRLTDAEQDRIFHPGRSARRIIISTNIAETSLTVPGIRYVVDTGFARLNRYDPARKIQRLPIEPISRASANQRSGRCGRVAEGVCIRLYSEESWRARPAFTDPEIRRVNLAAAILQMKSLGLPEIEHFPFIDPPDDAAIRDGYDTLFELGAIDTPASSSALTEIGRGMSRIPADPRIARILLAAEREGSLREVTVLASALSIQDPRDRPMGKQEEADRSHLVFRDESSDFLTLLRLWDQFAHATQSLSHSGVRDWCRERFVSAARMREWAEMQRLLAATASDLGLSRNDRPASADSIHRALLTGLITNAACREGPAGTHDYRGVRGNSVSLFPGSVLFRKSPKWIVAAEIVQTTRLYARTIARVEPEWIEELAGHLFQRQISDKHLDPESGEPSAWERVTLSTIVVVPRRRTALSAHDSAAARRIFLTEALAQAMWRTDAPFMLNNRRVLNEAKQAEAMLRRRGVLRSPDEIAAWFAARLPPDICEPRAFEAWRTEAERRDPRILMLSLADVLTPAAAEAIDEIAFPRWITLGADTRCPLDYAFAPGKDDDGITVTVPLESLPLLTAERAAWLVPGRLPDLAAALVRLLPKAPRAALETRAGPVGTDGAGQALAGVLTFADGPLPNALSEAASVLFDISIAPDDWPLRALPPHLVPRIRVVDESGRELAADRDLAALHKRFEGRIRKARAASSRAEYERDGLRTWDFDELPESIEIGPDGTPGFPALIDRGDSVSLTLLESRDEALRQTHSGLRRLYALACAEEVREYLDALPRWSEMMRQYAALGTADDLRDTLIRLIADRVFLAGQPMIRARADFESRSSAMWGRLATVSREVGEIVGAILEPRARVAHRLSGGTPRLWAESIADIREHAAYLMPSGFLLLLPWERLRRYPVYAESMRQRLLALREDGSGVEKDALRTIAPHWKRFTGWVVRAQARQRAADDEPKAASLRTSTGKAPLPAARRAAPRINLEAGEWAMQPGSLPRGIERYRWALEELRLTLFTPTLAGRDNVKPADLEQLWKDAESPDG